MPEIKEDTQQETKLPVLRVEDRTLFIDLDNIDQIVIQSKNKVVMKAIENLIIGSNKSIVLRSNADGEVPNKYKVVHINPRDKKNKLVPIDQLEDHIQSK
jgi:hypothetical protein